LIRQRAASNRFMTHIAIEEADDSGAAILGAVYRS
jgi:hypothetical protein